LPPTGPVKAEIVQLKNGDAAILAVTAVKPGEVNPAQRAQLAEPLQDSAGFADLQGYVSLMRAKATIKVDPSVFE
jgi:hypothetical protein